MYMSIPAGRGARFPGRGKMLARIVACQDGCLRRRLDEQDGGRGVTAVVDLVP